MARDKGKLDTILLAVVARLTSQVSEYNDATCYLSLDPDALPAPNPGTFVCVVAPTSGTFDQGMIMGGGVEQTTSGAGLVVKVHSPVQLDEPNRDTEFLTHASLGLIKKVIETVKALSGWDPLDSDDDEQTRDPLWPASYMFTRRDRSLGGCEIVFHLSFDWDLS